MYLFQEQIIKLCCWLAHKMSPLLEVELTSSLTSPTHAILAGASKIIIRVKNLNLKKRHAQN